MPSRFSAQRARSRWTRNRRYRQVGSFSGGVLQYQGDRELMKLLQDLSSPENLNKAVDEALLKSSEPLKKDMADFMDTHRKGMPKPATQNTEPRGRGQSNRYLGEWLKRDGDTAILRIGFEKRDYKSGASHESQKGLAALFLDIGTKDAMGTPLVRPTFFVYYAVNNNLDEVRRIQDGVINDYIERTIGD